MREKLIRTNIWKLEISEKMTVESVETALAESFKEVVQKADPEGADAIIDMIEIKEAKTIILCTGNEKTVKVFSKTLGACMPSAKVNITKVEPNEFEKLK